MAQCKPLYILHFASPIFQTKQVKPDHSDELIRTSQETTTKNPDLTKLKQIADLQHELRSRLEQASEKKVRNCSKPTPKTASLDADAKYINLADSTNVHALMTVS